MIGSVSHRATSLGALGLALLLGTSVAQAAHHASTPTWVITKAKTVNLTLIAAYNNTQGGFNFNGGANGKLVVTVPLGDKISVTFKNMGPLPHSAQVVAYSKTPPAAPQKDAFSGAHTVNPLNGTPKGVTQKFAFTANKAGQYLIICAVPGHASAGMWDTLIVSKTAKTASAVLKK